MAIQDRGRRHAISGDSLAQCQFVRSLSIIAFELDCAFKNGAGGICQCWVIRDRKYPRRAKMGQLKARRY